MREPNAEDAERRRTQSNTDRVLLDRTTHAIIGAAITVHTALGPGLLESTYEACVVRELRDSGITVERQVDMPLEYKGMRLDLGYRIDLLVNNLIIVELKAITKVMPIHEAQLLSYLRLTGLRVGLLINFHVRHLRDGIKRIVNNY